MVHAWDSVGSFGISAQALDTEGALSEWAEALLVSITVPSRPPYRPTAPIGRPTGHVGVSYEYETWTFEPDGDSVAILFAWGDGDTSDWSSYDTSFAHFKMSHVWAAAGTVYVTARAKDNHGVLSEWSRPTSLVVVDGNRSPETPGPPLGTPDRFVDSVSTFGAKTTDPDGDLVQFRFDWGDGDTSAWTNLVGSGVEATATHVWAEVGSYAVRVRARDELGSTSDWSDSLVVEVHSSYPRRTLKTVAVEDPQGVCVLASGTAAYIASGDRDEVSVLRTSSDSILAVVAVGDHPFAVASTPNSEKVYVTNVLSNDVSVIRTSDNEVIATVRVGSWPEGIAVSSDGKRAYVANGNDNSLSVVDTQLDSVVATIPTGSQPGPLALVPSGEFAYVACDGDMTVDVVRTEDGTVVDRVAVGSGLYGIAASPDGEVVCVSVSHSDEIAVIRAADITIVARIEVGDEVGPMPIAFLPDGRYLYTAGIGLGRIPVIRLADYRVVDVIPAVGYCYGLAVLPDGSKVYAAHHSLDKLQVIGF